MYFDWQLTFEIAAKQFNILVQTAEVDQLWRRLMQGYIFISKGFNFFDFERGSACECTRADMQKTKAIVLSSCWYLHWHSEEDDGFLV